MKQLPSLSRINTEQVPLYILWHEYLYALDEEERYYRCSVCKRSYSEAPGLCINCWAKVCENCLTRHRREHNSPVRTIGGNVICDGKKSFCGREGCRICGGIPF